MTTDHLHIGRNGWRTLTLAALALIVVGIVLTQVIAGVIIPPVAVFGALFLAIALIVWRVRSRWPLIVAVVAALLYAVASFPFLAEDLPHPSSVGSFVPASLILLGGIVTVVAGLIALIRPRIGGYRMVAGIAGLVAIALVGLSFQANRGIADAERQPEDVEVVAQNTDYPDVTVPAGGAVFVENRDLYRHTFVVEGTDILSEVPAQSSQRIELDLEPGSYRLYCDVAGHEGMEGNLTVSG